MNSLLRYVLMNIQAGISCKWTSDSRRVISEHFDAIKNSPSHIYYNALPFSPSSSWLHLYYTAESLQTVKVVKGLPAEWGMCFRTVLLDNCPLALACWKDTIAIGSQSPNIIIFDAITGSQVAILSGHTDQVNSLAFSPDGMIFVSGGDDTTVKIGRASCRERV